MSSESNGVQNKLITLIGVILLVCLGALIYGFVSSMNIIKAQVAPQANVDCKFSVDGVDNKAVTGNMPGMKDDGKVPH